MTPNPPQGQGPIDPQGVFIPPPTPSEGGNASPPEPAASGIYMNQTVGQQPPSLPPAGSYMPPGYGYPPPQPPRRGGFLRVLFMLLLMLSLVGSLLLNLLLLSTGGDSSEPTALEHVLRKGNAGQKIAVIEANGVIEGSMSARFGRLMDEIERDSTVQALVVEVDSPGGTVTASDEIYDRILRYKNNRKAAGKSALVVISMRSMATSGGYYIACAGDHIFAQQTTITGNIGVLMSNFNVSGLMQKYGVTESTVVSTGADFKNAGSPFSPETEEGKKYLQTIVDDAFGRFKQVVTTGRGAKISGQDIFNGKALPANAAKAAGLVDTIGYPEDAWAYAATTAALTNPQIVRFREPVPGLLDILVGGASAQTSTPAPAAKQMNLQDVIKPETLDQWRTTRLLYQ